MKLIIIGAGPGGYETAIEASKNGFDVLLVTDDQLGGTCLNRGCIPTKTYASSSSLNEALERKSMVIKQLRAGIDYLLKSSKVNIVYGKASFVNPKTIIVNDTEFSADNIIIATGSIPAILEINGCDEKKVVTSDELLEMSEIPETLSIIGGGVIGLEFACIFNKFGSKVTVLEYCNQILPHFDKELSIQLQRNLVKSGIDIRTGFNVNDIRQIEADKVLMAIGRKPNLNGLNLEKAGVSYTNKGIDIDTNMMTSTNGIYAIGDVNGKSMLAHVATFQGRRALNNILGKTDNIRFDIVPAVVFTTPEVASVGLTEEDCYDMEIDYKISKSYYRANGKAVSMGTIDGFCKLIVDNENGKLIGAHIMGAHASDVIHELTALMYFNATLEEIKNIIHAHPTLSEIVQIAINS